MRLAARLALLGLAPLLLFACRDESIAERVGAAGGSNGADVAARVQGSAGEQGPAGTRGSVATLSAAGTRGTAGTLSAAGTRGSAGVGGASAGKGGTSAAVGGAGTGNTAGSGGASGHTGATGTGSGSGGRGGNAGGVGAAGSFNPCPPNGNVCKVLPFGDSITFGVGSDEQGGGGYRVNLFSRAVMADKTLAFVGPESNGPTTVAGMPFPRNHAGYSGYTVAQITASSIFAPAVATGPHIVLLHIGTNDIFKSDASGAPQRLATLVDNLTTALPNALIVVAKIIPLMGATTQVNTYNSAIAPLIQQRASAGKHIVLVDQNSQFPASGLGSDGIHPNVSGYQWMAGVLYAAIGPLLP